MLDCYNILCYGIIDFSSNCKILHQFNPPLRSVVDNFCSFHKLESSLVITVIFSLVHRVFNQLVSNFSKVNNSKEFCPIRDESFVDTFISENAGTPFGRFCTSLYFLSF